MLCRSNDQSFTLAQVRSYNHEILTAGPNRDTIGRELHIGFQTLANFRDLSEALVANSLVLKPKHIDEARRGATLSGGARAYLILQPRYNRNNAVVSVHVVLFFKPERSRDGEGWLAESINDLKGGDMEGVAAQLYSSLQLRTTRAPPSLGPFERMQTQRPPDTRVGPHNVVLVLNKNQSNLQAGRITAEVKYGSGSSQVVYNTQ